MSNDVLSAPAAGLEATREILRGVTLLHQAFELRAAAEPDAVVLVAGEERVTRGELEARANQLAHYLIARGVGPEVRVAVCAERTLEMVIALYAVLKAGGAYVPIDPAYPEARQADILADSGALLLLTQERLAGRLPRRAAIPIYLDRDRPRIERESAAPPPARADESNLAYVIYTSGSTGRPKGVAIAHRSAVVLTRWAARIYSPEELAGVLAATSVCFDMSIFELFVTPALGGRAILADHALALPDLPAAGEVTLVNTVPSAAAELARSGGIPPGVRTLNLGGEALRGALVERLYRLGTVDRVYNVYGPSEDTTFSTWALVPPGDSRPPSIGRLLDGTWGRLLDQGLEPVSGGEAGELYLGGEGLARGYLGRPDLTAARFVPDPFAARPGERVYTTGDLIRYRPDGELDYLGRIDHQVKIRGFRVELGEIEATLERHSGVGDTVVVARDLGAESGTAESSGQVLVAYVVPRAGAPLEVDDLREHLRRSLADYMVPTHFVLLEALPLNPNGKVDRAALPAPERGGEQPALLAPRTPLEASLAAIWSEVLGVGAVGIEEDFFALGGHSLLAARAISRIHDVLGRRLRPSALFDAPTIERLAVVLTGLPAGEELQGIPLARDRRWIPSPGQEGMWFTERLNGGSPLFTIPLLLDLEGPLDRGALQRSLAAIVRRHEVLRVLYREVNGRPALALADATVDLPRIDLRLLPAAAQVRETGRVAAALGSLPMSLEEGPLLQGYLIERGERDTRLLVTLHHAAGDDWSTWVLTHDLAAFYTAEVTGNPVDLPALALQYSDYTAWQQEWLEGEEARSQLAFWREHLASSPEVLDLPTDRPRPARQSVRGAQLFSTLAPEDAQGLLSLALRSGTTLFTALLAVLETLLHRYSGQDVLTVGAAAANRHRAGTQELIGFFTNTLVLSTDLGGDPSFGELLRQARERMLAALDRQDVPFDRLVRELRPERRLSHPPLAQVILSFQNVPPLPRRLGPELGLRLHELGNGTSKVDLTIYPRQQAGTLDVVWEYATALFDASTIARLSGHFQRLVSAAVADPSRRVSELPLLTAVEQEQIERWQGKREPRPALTLQGLFRAQAALTPEAPAVIAEAGVLTYAELDERSSLLASRLQDLGIGPEVLVGLCLERSLEMVVALFAVLKAGGAYVPLDPEYPAERLAGMIDDAGLQVILTMRGLLPALAEARSSTVVCLDELPSGPPLSGRSAAPWREVPAGGENLAYVLFTSGSTGRPKGVAIPQRAIVNHMLWMQAEFPLHPADRVLQKTPFGFDASVWEFHAPLLAGAALVLAKPGGQRELGYLTETIRRHGVTTFQVVPSLLRAMLDDGRLAACGTLRRVFCGGEVLTADIQRDFFAALDAELINLYGPTETTIEIASWRCERERTDRTALLGAPITNARIRIFSPRLEPCPAGVPGEICISGLPVGRGYLGRPAETALRFIPEGWNGEPGGRLYRSGDLGRWLPDGTLEFLGRTDHQVKVRGFRIELGEVEAAIASHPAIAEAAVLFDGQRLAAFLAIRPEAAVFASDLRAFLRERLPEYMVPSTWTLLESLPHTTSGKVDRRTLSLLQPEPAADLVPVSEAPATPLEKLLAGIWRELGLGVTGVHENFFSLGGHSLLASQVAARLRKTLGVEVAVREIFETPTVAGLASILEAQIPETQAVPRIAPVDRSGLPPASFIQESLWFLYLLDPASPVYNLPMAWRLKGRLDAAALEAALDAVVRRHEVLRAQFVEIEGKPFLAISAPAPVALPRIDLSELPAGDRESELARITAVESGGPFDLARGPLLRACLVILSREEENALLLTVHHAVFDGWSAGVLARELAVLYEAAITGLPPRLAELPLQYADFATWQRGWLQGATLDRLVAWWRDELKGSPTLLELPTDRPRPAVLTFRGGWESLEIPGRATGAILALGRREGATTFMTLLAAFQALLHRLSGQDDLLLGAPVSNRFHPELEALIGYFVDVVVLRGHFQAEETFPQRLARVRETVLDAFSHQDLPFGQLALALQLERDLSRNPIFQVMFSLDRPMEPLSLRGLSSQPIPSGEPAAKFDLSLTIQEESGGLGAHLEYNLDLFDPATARRLLERFAILVEAVAADPGRRMDAIPLLMPAELAELLAESTRTASLGFAPRCLHDLFSAQAARTPDAVAVLTPAGERLTYAELDQRSRRLADFLVRRGVRPEVRVGVCMERSPEMVIALLGVLKAGGVYLPLDPAYPPGRLSLMLDDSGAAIVLARTELTGHLPMGRWEVVAIDGEGGCLPSCDDSGSAPPAVPALPENLAYLIYTSGSTGRPKGVGVSHAAAAEHFEAIVAMLEFGAGDRMLWFSSPSFDASMEEVFTPLVCGAAVVLRDAGLWSLAEFLDKAAELGVTGVDLPTAYWHQLAIDCERVPPPPGLALRQMIVGGEALAGEAARRWRQSPLAGIKLLNSYGPTEAIITATVLEVDAAAVAGVVPIGRALAGRSAWVLDRSGQATPAGSNGELCLGGPLLARGYLGRPGLTAERFVPDPFSAEPGGRLYRTGDLTRRRPDGVVEFVGRIDRQVKVRGFRVESGEIESALARHPAVREVVVDARPDQGGGQRLLAWVVPAGPPPASADLAGFLRGTLPDYMIPSAFLMIERLPLTPNGKIDLRALLAPEVLADGLETAVAPRTPTETRLAVLWEELLGMSRVGVLDSFFDLGGHSLLATRLLSRMRDAFSVEIPFRSLFLAPTIEGLAALVDGARPTTLAGTAKMAGGERRERPPLSFAQRSLWLVERLQPAGGAYNLPLALRFSGKLDGTALATALGGIVLRHEALRTRFVEAAGEPWQEVLPVGTAEPPLTDLGEIPEERREAEMLRLAGDEAGRPFDLAVGPLSRAHLFRLSRADHALLLTIHHAVSDGWSNDLIQRDLAALYRAAVDGSPAELPPLPLQLADYALWEREHLRGEVLAELLAVWRRRLAGVPPLALPTDHRRPASWSFRGASRGLPLAIAAADLEGLVRSQQATPFMALLACLEVLLGRYAGQDDFAIGTPSANRDSYDVENVVGFFVNMLPLRAELSGAPTFGELLARVRATALEAFSHQGLPFELLVEALAPERDLGRNPIFQVAFQLAYAEDLDFPGITAQRFALEGTSAKFDLNLAVTQEKGRLAMSCEYSVDLYEGTTIQRLFDHFQTLVAGALAHPDCKVSDLPLLTAGERGQLLVGFNDTGSTSGPELCLHQLFEAEAARVPDQVALVAPDARLTYRELNGRADRLAHRLRSLGLGPEILAGVLMDRTADLIVTLLAIHKAGGAYAPLDPNYPQQRVLLMLETARAKVLVTRRRLAEALGDELPAGLQTVFLDPGWEAEPVEESAARATALPDNLAYVIFTSGSTGVPKGVAIQHRSAVAMIRWAREMYSAEEYAGVLASTSICFDMSVFEIFATLGEGGKLILAENALALPDLEAKDEVVLVDTVPSAMAELLRLGRLPPSIRTVNLGGEPLKGSLVEDIYARLPSVERVVNLYGPSEDTTFTSFSVVPRDAQHPLIGRPLTGESAYVLDSEMRPVPLGIPGALYMGGEGVTRGYLGRPDLTAERYIPNPYGPSGSRLYAVGDLVRYLPTGELDFLGRLDHQVKVRGYRVELGEIEAVLTRHPEVQDAAVLAAPEEGGGSRLIAFLETVRDLAPGELRAFLKASLPDYMVPSAFVTLRELPLTPNGKIDRRALAALPSHSGITAVDGDRAPHGYAEEVLAGIWGEIFGQAVGVNENFFDLGGHSLLATRVASRVREAFGIELPLRRLFEQPTVASLAVSVEAALGAGSLEELPRIERVPRTGPLPLSFSQRRLWFLDQLSPGSGVYNIPHPLTISGHLDFHALSAALTEVVRRHESLRTTFPSLDGEPSQVIAPAGPFPLPVFDLTGIGKERDREAARLVERESLRPFDLGAGPTFRAALIELSPERHILLLAMHHIVSDGWSLEILVRELIALYAAFTAGLPASLPELPVQYADFAVWQRRWLTGETLSRQLDFWRRQLGGAPAGLDLPTDFPRPAIQTFNGATRSAELPAEVAADLKAFCRREGVTLFMLLLAGFDALLARYSGQRDILVGSPIANRNRAETEGLIGFFVNTLVLRNDLGATASFRGVLRQARETALAAYGHQDLPFETLVEELRPERDLSRSPFFQVLLSAQTAGRELPATSGLTLAEAEGELDSAKFDLSLFVTDASPALRMTAEYNTDLFEGATALRLLGHLGILLAAAVAEPERGWRDLPLLTVAEREQLAGFNDTGSTTGPEICLHQLFEAQAARIPDQVALVAPDARLTYRELNGRADRLARRLRSLGLGPEILAGVLMDRTADLIVTLLAVHKAGGAYAPLDPNYPKQRVLLMLETARAKVLVTRRHLAAALGDELPAGLRTVFLDPGWEAVEEPEARGVAALPDNLAYVIFTSGSTGVPKGVAIQHRSAVAMIRWAHGMYSAEEYAGVLASTSICFDMSVFEIFATLAAGGRLVLAENALALPDLEAKDDVVLVDTVPSAMAELLRLGRLPPSIRTVNLGGEPLKASLVRAIYARLPSVERVVNLYGPSEDTTFTSFSVVPRDAGHPLIGRPLTGESAHVLDAEMRPVPLGVPGALYMGGEGVTRGYLGRPDLTAERYIPNPYGPPGSRLYTVGDLVRYLPTGELDFLGRLDHQVKVRGYRVELGEIESALTRHPEIQDAAVLAAPEEEGGNRLIAWVESARDLAPGDLRAFLKASLPDYMIPSAFVTLRELPLTPNGKIDRRALAAALPAPTASTMGDGGHAPRSYAEEVLAGIWGEIFGHAVGVHESFFDLGGHSLLATRVASRAREAFGIELPLRLLFERPTIADLAAGVESALGVGSSLEAPPITPVPRTGRVPLSFAQRRLWFLDQLSPNSAAYNLPYPLSLEGALDPGILRRALEAMVERHEALRTTFPVADGEPYQEIAAAGPFPLPAVDLRGLAERRREALIHELVGAEALRPFVLGAGPLLRTTLLQVGRERHILLLTMHHIVSDGWSMEILLRELMALYEAFAAGRPSPLPTLPIQYAEFAVWQRRWLSGEALARQVEYWRRQLAGAPAGLDLPTDFQRPAVQTFGGSSRSIYLPDSLAASLKQLCQREGITLFMLLLAVLDVLLARYSGQRDILVGSPVANRNRAETEGLIGFFVNTLVLRTSLPAGAPFRDLLRQVRETALAAYSHQDLPFETLVEELRPERDLSRSPFFQVLFSHQSVRRDLPGLRDLKLSFVEGESETAKFDLGLTAVEAEETLWLAMDYNTDLFEGATAGRFLGHLCRLLGSVVGSPEREWSDLPILPETERAQLLAGFNDTGSTAGPEVCLHQLFEAQVARIPDQVALVAPDGRLSYRELNDRADRLALRLRALGIGPEALAGVLMDRTADLIVALLAIHKAGGAYVPLDPKYPRQRVLLMLETSRAKVLISRRGLAEPLADGLPAGMATLFLDPGWEGEPVEEGQSRQQVALPDNLAYVIFTSGSTGVPKGVAIQHRSAVAMIRWARTVYSPEEYAGMLASTSVCFDMSVFEIFATLAEGGKLVLAENALALPDLAAAGEVVLIDTVPSAMAELLRLGRLPPSVRTVNLGGEQLKGSLVREIYRQLPSVERVINLYGPSEDTTFSAWSVVPRDARNPLIGRPLTGESAYVLDAGMNPVPLGIPGALYLGGEGVTRGYLGRPDLTAERFVPDPFGPPGSRLYQVGDLVRYRPTGELDFLGRLDHQVKVRGFRIELGEIEAELSRHPEVREAAVLAIPEDAGGNRLAAWVETAHEGGFTAELRTFLKRALPDYMVPSIFVPLPEMPRTPNGKVDRRALAAMPLQPEDGAEAGRAPRNYVEEVLVAVWSEVFDRAVGVGESFFDLGGHSLLAIRVVSRIRSVLNVELPLQHMFAAPTIEGLAVLIAREMENQRGVPLPALGRASREGELPLSFAQQRLWFLDRLQPGTATFNLPAPLRLTGYSGVAALSEALDEIVRRHESLRTRFGEREGRGYQEVLPAAPIPLPRVDLTGLPAAVREREAQTWSDLEARLPFDLTRGPLLRTALIELSPGDALLLVTQHHIVTDGWSSEIFARELRELHAAFAAGRPSPLPEPPLQYPDFAVWQRGALDGETLKALLADWKQRFGTDVPPLRLPTDRPRPAVQTYPGAIRSLRLSEDLTRDVHTLARRASATLFMTLIGAFQALLHRYSGQERIVVGSPVAGRGRPELEGMIGFFVNTLVLPADLSGDLTFRQLLDRSREMALGAYAFQDLPFERLVEALQPVRDNSRSPLFQAMFLLHQHVREAAGSEGGEGALRVEPFGAGTGTSQFDLTLYAAEEPGGMEVGVEYNTDLFDAATMDRLLEHYRNLLAGAVANPEIRLADLPVPPLTTAPQIVADAAQPAAKPEARADARRDRLSSRLSKLSPAQLEALERRMKGSPGAAAPPVPSGRSLVEIVPAAPGTAGRPFFCIHPAGGDVLCFFPLARLVGSAQAFYGLQARGLEDTAEPFATIGEMAAHYASEIRSVQPSGPYRVGGWSFGGLAAFELARQLHAAGEEVELLVVMDTAPGVDEAGSPAAADDPDDHTGWLLTIAEYIKGLRGKDLGVAAADLRPLAGEAQLRLFVERLKDAGIVHSGDSLEQLRRLLRVFKINVQAYRAYVPQPYAGPITLIRAEQASFPPDLGPDLGWEKLTPHPIDRQQVPGDHITLLAEPHVRTLADRLRARLGGSERS